MEPLKYRCRQVVAFSALVSEQEGVQMFRRRPVVGQRRGPSLLRTAATTAVVAGTATAVSKGVSGSMDQAAMSKQQQMEQQQATQNAAAPSQAELEQMKTQLAAMQA